MFENKHRIWYITTGGGNDSNDNGYLIRNQISPQKLEGQRKWYNIFKGLQAKNCQWRILYTSKISFKNEGDIKTFSDKWKLRELLARSALKELVRKFFREKANYTRRKLGTSRMKKEQQKWTYKKNEINMKLRSWG